jgi:hypothetical protein
MAKLLLVVSFSLMVAAVFLAGCDGQSSGVGGGPPDGGDDGGQLQCGTKPVSLANDIKPHLSCGAELCHGFLSANPYSWWVGKPSTTCMDGRLLVTPGDPSKSYVLNKLTNHDLCSGSPMPKSLDGNYNPLPTDVLQAINDWICQGAKNN